MRISDWSSDVCSSDLVGNLFRRVLSDISPKIRGKPGRVRFGFGLRIHRITADVGSLAIIRGLGGFLIAHCRHQQGGKRKSEAFYPAHECASSNCSCRSEEHTSELQSLIRISYAVFCLTKKPSFNFSYA